jgi:signal transduction histidine kinase
MFGRRTEAWTRIGTIAAAVALVALATSLGATLYSGYLILVFGLALLHSGSLVLALVRPPVAAVLSVLASFGLMVVAHLGGGAPWPWAVTTMITQALVIGLIGYRATWMLGALTLVGNAILAGVAARVIDPPHELNATAVNMVLFASAGLTALIAGIVLRQWQVIGTQLARERRVNEEERTRRVVAEEKTRIARELHDVIAHSMSIINVQASSAPFRHPQADGALRDEFEDIAASSRRALVEMRSLLSVLRDDSEPIEKAPQPVLSRIPELIEQSVTAGIEVTLSGAEELGDDGVSELTGLAAYRIVQEALSNVIRHAPGAKVQVGIRREPEHIEITIHNGRASRAGQTTSDPGHGLIGMRERAASVGGSVKVGPTLGGGYEVRAVLPLSRRETEDAE